MSNQASSATTPTSAHKSRTKQAPNSEAQHRYRHNKLKTKAYSENDSIYDATPRSSPGPPCGPSCSDTQLQPFEPLKEHESKASRSLEYEHISAMPAHENYTPEETLTDHEKLESRFANHRRRMGEQAKERRTRVQETEIIIISSDSETDISPPTQIGRAHV